MLNVGNQRLVHHPAGQRELEERHRQRVFMCVGGEALKRGGGMLSVKYFPILLAFSGFYSFTNPSFNILTAIKNQML